MRIYPEMKNTLYFMALLLMATATFSRAQSNATSSLSLTSYTDKSSMEVRQLRAQIGSVVEATPLAGQPQLSPYLNALSAAEQALADFKTASEMDRDRRQTEFEAAKDRALRLWNDYRSVRKGAETSSRLDPATTEATP